MADAAGVRAGRAYVEIGTNNAPLTSGLRRAAQQVKAFGQAMQAGGMAAVRGGAILGIPLGFGAKMFGEFESWMARVKALAGPTADQFAALNKEALRLGAETVFTSTDAAKAMSIFAQAGLKANDILKATGPTLDLAATGMMDMAAATDIALKVMKGMGLQTSQLGATVDVLAKAMTTANTDLVMLGEAFKFVGPVAKSAGMSIHETVAAIQLLSDAGIQAEMAGTTLRGMILSLASPSEEAKKEMQKLGVQAVDPLTGQFRGLIPIIADMEKALKGVGSGARLLSLGTIFTARQAAGAAELLDQGAEKLLKYTDALKAAGGTAARVATTQLDTLRGAWLLLTSSLEGTMLAVGKSITPLLRQWGETLVGVTNAVTKMVEKNPELFQTLAKVSVGLVAGGAALVAAGLAINGVIGVLGAFGAALGAVVAVVKGAWVTSMFLLFSPLGVIVTALGTVAVASGAAGGAVRFMGEQFTKAAATVSTAWGGMVQAMKAGNLALAAKLGWAAVKVVWFEAIDELRHAWRKFILDTFTSEGSAGIGPVQPSMDTIRAKKRLRMLTFQANQRAEADAAVQDARAIGGVLADFFGLRGRIAAKVPEIGAGMAQANARMEASGTFSSFGVGQSLAFGKSLAERAAGAAEETAKNTKELVKQGGGRFG